MENKITKLEQRIEQLEKILRIYNNLLHKVINHIELETVTDLIGDVHNITSYMDVMTVGTTKWHAERVYARKEQNENPC